MFSASARMEYCVGLMALISASWFCKTQRWLQSLRRISLFPFILEKIQAMLLTMFFFQMPFLWQEQKTVTMHQTNIKKGQLIYVYSKLVKEKGAGEFWAGSVRCCLISYLSFGTYSVHQSPWKTKGQWGNSGLSPSYIWFLFFTSEASLSWTISFRESYTLKHPFPFLAKQFVA